MGPPGADDHPGKPGHSRGERLGFGRAEPGDLTLGSGSRVAVGMGVVKPWDDREMMGISGNIPGNYGIFWCYFFLYFLKQDDGKMILGKMGISL